MSNAENKRSIALARAQRPGVTELLLSVLRESYILQAFLVTTAIEGLQKIRIGNEYTEVKEESLFGLPIYRRVVTKQGEPFFGETVGTLIEGAIWAGPVMEGAARLAGPVTDVLTKVLSMTSS